MLFDLFALLQVADFVEVAVADQHGFVQPRHFGCEPHPYRVGRAGLVERGALDPADQHVGGKILRESGRHDLLSGLRVGVFRQLAEDHHVLVQPVPIDRAVIFGVGELAAGPERGVQHRHRHGVAFRAVDDVAGHRAVGREDGHLFDHAVLTSAVERDEVLRPVDRVGHDRCRDEAVFRFADVLHIAVQPRVGFGLLVLGEPLFELCDAAQQQPVFVSEAEVTPYAREKSVHASRHLVRPCEQPGLGVVGGVGVVADGRDLQRHEQHHDVDASYELEQFAQSSSLI